MNEPTDAVLLAAAHLLIECNNDKEAFTIAEITLRNILMERASAAAIKRL